MSSSNKQLTPLQKRVNAKREAEANKISNEIACGLRWKDRSEDVAKRIVEMGEQVIGEMFDSYFSQLKFRARKILDLQLYNPRRSSLVPPTEFPTCLVCPDGQELYTTLNKNTRISDILPEWQQHPKGDWMRRSIHNYSICFHCNIPRVYEEAHVSEILYSDVYSVKQKLHTRGKVTQKKFKNHLKHKHGIVY